MDKLGTLGEAEQGPGGVPIVRGRAIVPEGGPIRLTPEQEQAAKMWAADDRLWTTQETVEFNLRTFARVILNARRE
jgi:hypothetical protein